MMSSKIHRDSAQSDLRDSLDRAVQQPRRLSLVDQTVEIIRDTITGQLQTEFLPSEDALRQQLGVSRVTLRKALAQLAGQGWLKLGGRGKKHMVCRKSAAAPSSDGGVVRCLSPLTEAEVVWGTRIIFDEIRAGLSKLGRSLLFEKRLTLWRGNPERRLRQLTSEPGTAAWLLYRATPQIQRWFLKNEIPCLVLGPCHDGVALPSVQVDVNALGRHVAAEAARLGHEHIGFLVYDPDVASAVATLNGLRELKTNAGLPITVTVVRDDTTVNGLRAILAALMASPNRPTLLLLAAAPQSLPVMGILHEMGIRVPEDVSVVVRDHEPYLTRSVPELTRYTFDWLKLGRNATRLIASVIESGSGKNTDRCIMPEFIRGATIGPAPNREPSRCQNPQGV